MDRACTAPGRASASRAALRSPWPSPATAVRGFPSSRSHSPVHILRGRATQKSSTPRSLGAPYLAGGGWFSRQLLCTSPSLTSCQEMPTLAAHAGFPSLLGHLPPQAPGCPPIAPAGRVGLGEHLTADPTAEAPLPQKQPHRFPPHFSVSLALLAPLMHLPGRMTTAGADGLPITVAGHYLDAVLPLLHTQYHCRFGIIRQAGQSQPDRDTILMHLTSFPALSLYSPTRLQECQVLSLLNCIHTEQCGTQQHEALTEDGACASMGPTIS